MVVAGGRDLAAAGRANHQAAAQQKRLDFVDQRVGGQVHRVGHGFDADRPAVKHADDRLQVLAVLAVEPKRVDALHVERRVRQLERDVAVGLAGDVVAHPAQAVVRQPRRAAAAGGDLAGRVGVDVQLQLCAHCAPTISASSSTL